MSGSIGSTGSIAREAMRLQALGLRVFPVFGVENDRCTCGDSTCPAPGKHPLVRWGRQATDDPRQVATWWQQWPHANLAVCTGDGLVVVDVDDREIAEDLREMVPDETPVVKTSRGMHFYFAGDATTGVDADKHIDVRGHGGYVIVPPSRHVSGSIYEWDRRLEDEDLPPMPQIIADLLFDDPVPRGGVRVSAVGGALTEGSRNDGLFHLGASLRAAGALDQELPEMLRVANDVRCSPSLEDAEVAAIAKSVLRYPVGAGIGSSARADKALLEFNARPFAVSAYIALRSFANGEGTCFPSYDTIGTRAGMSRQAAINAVARLEQLGLVQVDHRKNTHTHQTTSNLYTVIDAVTGSAVGRAIPSPDGAWEAVMAAEDLAGAES